MSTTLPAYSIITEGRVRRSCGSVELQTRQSQPKVGTPIDVPLPSTVSVAFMRGPSCSSSAGSSGYSRLRWTRQGVGHFHVRHTYFVKAVLQENLFRRCQVAFRLLHQKGKGIDGLARSDNVHARLLPLLMHQSQLQHRSHVK